MSARSSKKSHAFSTSCTVFLLLLGGTIFAWKKFPVPTQYLDEAFIGIAFFTIALVTVAVYQSLKIYESAHILAKDMTKDMLMYSHELFSELYRSSPVPYILIDGHGMIESINFSTARLFHVDLEALNGLDVFTFIEDDEKSKVALIPEYFKQDKFVNDVEVQIVRPDGAKRWVLLSLFSFKDGKHDRKGLLTLVDITKQKLVDKAKTEFVSLASHQLRTPISGMKWNIELLLTSGKEHLTPFQHVYVEKVQHGLERMDMLVADFLSVSKFELGTLTPEYTDIHLASFLQGICDEYTPTITRKNIRLETSWEGVGEVFHSDSHLLHMIVSNLLGNAVKYTPENGTIHLHVTDDGSSVLFTIQDTGMGIPLEEQEMIFSKMFRASNARAQVTDGTGLGLYIVREAAKVLGGDISFTSEEGAGTTFVATVPR